MSDEGETGRVRPGVTGPDGGALMTNVRSTNEA